MSNDFIIFDKYKTKTLLHIFYYEHTWYIIFLLRKRIKIWNPDFFNVYNIYLLQYYLLWVDQISTILNFVSGYELFDICTYEYIFLKTTNIVKAMLLASSDIF